MTKIPPPPQFFCEIGIIIIMQIPEDVIHSIFLKLILKKNPVPLFNIFESEVS